MTESDRWAGTVKRNGRQRPAIPDRRHRQPSRSRKRPPTSLTNPCTHVKAHRPCETGMDPGRAAAFPCLRRSLQLPRWAVTKTRRRASCQMRYRPVGIAAHGPPPAIEINRRGVGWPWACGSPGSRGSRERMCHGPRSVVDLCMRGQQRLSPPATSLHHDSGRGSLFSRSAEHHHGPIARERGGLRAIGAAVLRSTWSRCVR